MSHPGRSHNESHNRGCPMTAKLDPASQANAALVDELYRQWKADPASVGTDWQVFFQGFELGFARPAEEAADGTAEGA
ncbi:MAG: hypothetical protein J0M02_16035, partial [Planctomycetes bacterium]|nr:hypothetical protein [Planctomycetota bacterium]